MTTQPLSLRAERTVRLPRIRIGGVPVGPPPTTPDVRPALRRPSRRGGPDRVTVASWLAGAALAGALAGVAVSLAQAPPAVRLHVAPMTPANAPAAPAVGAPSTPGSVVAHTAAPAARGTAGVTVTAPAARRSTRAVPVAPAGTGRPAVTAQATTAPTSVPSASATATASASPSVTEPTRGCIDGYVPDPRGIEYGCIPAPTQPSIP